MAASIALLPMETPAVEGPMFYGSVRDPMGDGALTLANLLGPPQRLAGVAEVR